MILYHYTAGPFLRGIAQHGLTVGDVPTDILHFRGRVGVWLTTSDVPAGHGLEGAKFDKTEFRLAVDIPDPARGLVRWTEWAPKNATAATIDALNAGRAEQAETWYIHFAAIPPERITSCTNTVTCVEVVDWRNASPPHLDAPSVPPGRREAWHSQLMKQLRFALRQHGAGSSPAPRGRQPAAAENSAPSVATEARRSAAELVAILQTAKVLVALYPDGKHTILAGMQILERIKASGQPEEASVATVRVGSSNEADVIASARKLIERGGMDAPQIKTFESRLDRARNLR